MEKRSRVNKMPLTREDKELLERSLNLFLNIEMVEMVDDLKLLEKRREPAKIPEKSKEKPGEKR